MTETIAQFANILVTVLYVAIIGRVIVSWLSLRPDNPIVTILHQITEPILAPLRRIVPRAGILDLTPMIALILLWIVQRALSNV
ncbi:MAG: YggT family protein [Chloroflexi bacterium]|nr:YggT family protein [Chloroflexota bacterium]